VPDKNDSFPIRKPIDEEGHVLDLQSEKNRFKLARIGDHLMTHFQCDLCHFRNVQGWDPDPNCMNDDMILMCIRRANLDTLWSRESKTVYQNWREGVKFITKARKVGLNCSRNLPALGPFPVRDEVSMFTAITLLMRSLDPGINETTIQFATARKFRSFFFNYWNVSVKGSQLDTVAVRETTKLIVTSSPTNKDWFERFLKGMHCRMGDTHHPDLGISIEIMVELMKQFERDWRAVEKNQRDWRGKKRVIFPALFSIVAYCGALRGEEVPLMDLVGVRRHHYEGMNHPQAEKRHTLAALLGRFKTETGEKYHLMPLAKESASGLKPGLWMERMLEWYREQGIGNGPVFRSGDGDRAKALDFQVPIFEKLLEIQLDLPELISRHVDVMEEYGLSRSFRRGADTRAMNAGVSDADIDLNCR
jgi:hypothetical protein